MARAAAAARTVPRTAAPARSKQRSERSAAARSAATATRAQAAAGRPKATATRAKAAAGRPKATATRAQAAAGRPKATATRAQTAPARRAQPARHGTRRRAPSHGRAAPRRVSGAVGAPAVALPVRVLNAPFARAARRGTSGVLDALLSGRGWIALVFVLLAGIVFFNVDLLQMNREIARNAEKISTLKRDIARNRLDVARLASSERIQESAAGFGLVLPAPGEVRYLEARPTRDAERAAKRITAPNLTYVAPEPIDTAPVPPAAGPTTTDPAATDPAATDPTYADPAATDSAATDPAAADPTYADPAATDPAAAPPAG
jgi:cell division protein FtsL